MSIGKLAKSAFDSVTGSSTISDAMAKKKQQSPQYDFLWRVELPSLDEKNSTGFMNNIGSSFMDFVSTSLGGGISPSDLNHRIVTFDSPFFQLDTKKVTNKNSFWYTASNNDIGEVTLTIQEMEDGKSLQYFDNWRRLIINDDGTYNPPAMYKRPITFYRLSATKLDLHKYTYEGFFVNEISTMSNTYDSNDITTYSITLTGDAVAYEFMSGAEVRSNVMIKEVEIMAKQWVNQQTQLAGSGLQNVLQTAGGLF